MKERDKLVYEKITQVVKLLDEIDEMINDQSSELQKADYEISDWLHYIENSDIGKENSVKILNKVKELRQTRRTLHREYEIENAYKNNSSKMMGNNTRQLLLAEINKAVKRYDNEYKNRVLTEEDIKAILEPTKKKAGRPKKVEKEGENNVNSNDVRGKEENTNKQA